jgi:hypothetical protein
MSKQWLFDLQKNANGRLEKIREDQRKHRHPSDLEPNHVLLDQAVYKDRAIEKYLDAYRGTILLVEYKKGEEEAFIYESI